MIFFKRFSIYRQRGSNTISLLITNFYFFYYINTYTSLYILDLKGSIIPTLENNIKIKIRSKDSNRNQRLEYYFRVYYI
jgi:hypothetical protein